MAVKTRSITQYQILTLVNIVRDKKNNAGGDIERRELVAIFDDEKKAQDFLKGEDRIYEFELMPEWVEVKPAASNYSLPFNPKAGEVEITSTKAAKRKK